MIFPKGSSNRADPRASAALEAFAEGAFTPDGESVIYPYVQRKREKSAGPSSLAFPVLTYVRYCASYVLRSRIALQPGFLPQSNGRLLDDRTVITVTTCPVIRQIGNPHPAIAYRAPHF